MRSCSRPARREFYSPIRGRKLLLACPETQLWGFLIVDTNPAATNGAPFHISVGAGFNYAEGRCAGAARPTSSNSRCHPWPASALPTRGILVLVRRGHADPEQRDHALEAQRPHRPQSSSSGRRNEIGDATVQLRFEPGAFERARSITSQSITAGLPDLARYQRAAQFDAGFPGGGSWVFEVPGRHGSNQPAPEAAAGAFVAAAHVQAGEHPRAVGPGNARTRTASRGQAGRTSRYLTTRLRAREYGSTTLPWLRGGCCCIATNCLRRAPGRGRSCGRPASLSTGKANILKRR